MSRITTDEVRHVAALAKLPLSDADAEKYQGELESILGYFEQLQEIDTANIKETAQVTGQVNTTRDDIVTPMNPEMMHALTACAPHNTKDGAILIPKIM